MRMPFLVISPSEVNLSVAEFDSDLNIEGLMECRLPFAEKILELDYSFSLESTW